MDVKIISIDHGLNVVPDINLFPEAELYCHEFPVTEDNIAETYSLLNYNYKSIKDFTKTVKRFLKKNYNGVMLDSVFQNIYETKSKCKSIQPIGCFSKNIEENKRRFNRSVNITNNILSVLKEYDDIIKFRIEGFESKYKRLKDYDNFLSEYKSGKTVFLEKFVLELFEYSGLNKSEINASVVSKTLEEMFPADTSNNEINEKVFISPKTISSVFSQTKKRVTIFPIDSAVLVVGGPHHKMVEYFISKKYKTESICLVPDNRKFYDTPELDNEIMLAEKQNLIKF